MSTRTLADIVTEQPSAARVLERHQLDYCCGGKRTLLTACHDAGIDADRVLAELEAEKASDTEADWAHMSPAELVDHIETTHHQYLHEELPRLDALARKVFSVHGARHPELANVMRMVAELHVDLEPHLAKEERVLFPMIRRLTAQQPWGHGEPTFHCGSVANPIRMMHVEHDRTGELLAVLRATTAGFNPPADACASYQALYRGLAELEADVHLHVHKENNVLFPAVMRIEAERAAQSA